MRKFNKKADYVWISWVLLMAFAVSLSAVMYNWIFGFSTTAAEKIEERTQNEQECNFVGISVDSFCQDPRNLYLTIANRDSLHIDRVKIRMFDVFNEPTSETKTHEMFIEPGKTATVVTAKQGLVKTVEVIPVIIEKRREITCTERVTRLENITDADFQC